MKRKIYFLLAGVLVSTTLLPLGFDDLLGGDDAFSNFDFNNMGDMFGDSGFDFGGFGGAGDSDGEDPFSSLFNQFEDSDSSTQEAAKKKEVTPPVAATLEEAFKNAIDAKVTKLTPQYKKAIAQYLSTLVTKLQQLITHCSSFALGIKLKNDLKPSVVTLNEALQAATQAKTTSLYNLALLGKEFNALREHILKAPGAIETVSNLYVALSTNVSSALDDAPTSKEIAARKKAFDQTESLIKKTISPLCSDFKKLFTHKSLDARVKTKKKKHAAKVKGSSAGASGGWNSNAGGYFNDDYGYGSGYGSSSWDSGSDYWGGSDFGGGYGGYDDWGSSYGNYGSSSYNDWGSSSRSSSSSPSSSSNGMRSFSAVPQASSTSSFDDDDMFNSSSDTKKQTGSAGGYQENVAELPPLEQLAALLPLITKNIPQWSAKKERITLKALLEDSSFAADIERINRVISLYKNNEDLATDAIKNQYVILQAILKDNITVLIEAAVYASPPFAALFEEKAAIKQGGLSQQQAHAQIEQRKRQRAYAYQQLLQFLSLIRAEHETSPLFGAIVEKLCGEGKKVLKQLEAIATQSESKKLLSLEELIVLAGLSRKLFHEPIAIGYASIDTTEETTEKLAQLKEHKNTVTELVAPLVKKQYEVIHLAITLIEEAVAAVRSDLNLAEGQQLALTQISAIQALAGKVDSLLSTTYKDNEHAGLLRSLLLPYDVQKYQHLELAHGMLVELMECWNGVKSAADESEADADGSESDEEEFVSE